MQKPVRRTMNHCSGGRKPVIAGFGFSFLVRLTAPAARAQRNFATSRTAPHGALASHIAIQERTGENNVQWLEQVSDKWYVSNAGR